jgi:hypothetical protein
MDFRIRLHGLCIVLSSFIGSSLSQLRHCYVLNAHGFYLAILAAMYVL